MEIVRHVPVLQIPPRPRFLIIRHFPLLQIPVTQLMYYFYYVVFMLFYKHVRFLHYVINIYLLTYLLTV